MEFNYNSENNSEIIYVGDPMCSWCYGIAPQLILLRDYFKEKAIGFKIVVGGLRPGGGDPWNDEMKSFLKHHWEEVHKMSGQPFGYGLFKKEGFNYDTEPACRAVVAARPWLGNRELEFFEAIQKKFYVDSEDPSTIRFYNDLCTKFDIDFELFTKKYQNQTVVNDTYDEFRLNRQWGVRGYPTVLFRTGDELYLITNGYAKFDQMKIRLLEILDQKAV